jgi:hypothetical protein
MGEFECTKCNKIFTYKSNLSKHDRSVHSGLKPYSCNKCNNTFSQNANLKAHIARKHDKVAKVYPHMCVICKKAFERNNTLQEHIDNVHNELRKYNCSICNKPFATRGGRSQHIKTVHEMSLVYPCKHCTLKCKTDKDLRIHVDEVHNKLKPFQCRLCKKSFSRNETLTDHVKIVHDKVKEYVCTVCNLSFGRNNTLIKHMLIHTGDYPYVCTDAKCGMNFRYSYNLASHIKSRHSGNIVKYVKVEEQRIYDLLEYNCIPFDYNNTLTINDGTGKIIRPDFMVQINNCVIIIEVDEHGHGNLNLTPSKSNKCETYSVSCEQNRMMNIISALRLTGENRPIGFIRYNPHSYTVNKIKCVVDHDDKEEMLIDVLNHWSSSRDFNIQYMYYDSYSVDKNLRCCIWDHVDYERKLIDHCFDPIV